MNNIFKLLIAAIVFGVLLYIILTLFVFKSSDHYLEISKTLKSATFKAGEPTCSKVDIKKGDFLTTNNLIGATYLKDLKIFVWFSGNNKNFELIPKENGFSFLAKENFKQLDFCVICYPGILLTEYPDLNNILENNDLFCGISFGSKLVLLNYDLHTFNSQELQGEHILNTNIKTLPVGYTYKIFVLNNEKNQTVSKDSLSYLKQTKDIFSDAIYSFDSKALPNVKFDIPKAGEKLILQAVMQLGVNPYLNLILPAQFKVQAVDVQQNEDYQKIDCKSTTSEKKYKNYEKNKCVVYNYCEGCTLATYCSDVWNAKGQAVEPESAKYAISYLPIESCD